LTQEAVVNAVDKFLTLKKPGSRNIYAHGLAQFQKFYEPQGTIESFLDRVEAYLNKSSWRERQDMPTPTDVLKDFTKYLQVKGLSPNSVRSYVSRSEEHTSELQSPL
jgi:hypothetical protein